jgi:hypothetical protein
MSNSDLKTSLWTINSWSFILVWLFGKSLRNRNCKIMTSCCYGVCIVLWFSAAVLHFISSMTYNNLKMSDFLVLGAPRTQKEHTSRGRHKVFNKVGLFKTNTVSSVYMRITTFPNFCTRGYRSHQMLLIQN